jgi:hypothetical protein
MVSGRPSFLGYRIAGYEPIGLFWTAMKAHKTFRTTRDAKDDFLNEKGGYK